ncbi:ferrochelatase [Hippea maritima]|uniref:Ferrochelatase n=1 Tax=Hippea maritima (strain ATCC 700847 / DSM 10411 / MH2) TaxID=760142 RepID=F2LX08_HIPMA|nr:ferrochelatase [Hippea maritima]AEA34192.1 ferrochelatase [Hippea maritima DSM 10411]
MKQAVLVNLGGIEKPTDIPVFLFSMFNDKHIMPLKQPFRAMVAFIITLLRAKKTYNILKLSPSPLVRITKRQAEKLSIKTNKHITYGFSYSKPYFNDCEGTFIVMQNFYSHTTHGKVLELKRTKPPLCIHKGFFELFESRINNALKNHPNAAILLSAHSLPLKLLKKTNDPYRNDLEVFRLALSRILKKPIYLSFQSRLGPIEWLKPETEKEIKRLSKHYTELIILPVSFTTDNTETIVEIDRAYTKIAKDCGFRWIKRVNCFNDDGDFIEFLASIL